jgi:hypothetical protein
MMQITQPTTITTEMPIPAAAPVLREAADCTVDIVAFVTLILKSGGGADRDARGDAVVENEIRDDAVGDIDALTDDDTDALPDGDTYAVPEGEIDALPEGDTDAVTE